MYCPICNRDTTFAVYDSIDQGMCMNCGTILFEFSMMEKVREINGLKEQKEDESYRQVN